MRSCIKRCRDGCAELTEDLDGVDLEPWEPGQASGEGEAAVGRVR